jgi:hypothetical protein
VIRKRILIWLRSPQKNLLALISALKLIPLIDVARALLGEEGRERSNGVEKHFPNHGGLFVNVEKNRWYSHGNATGGDALELVRFIKGCGNAEGLSWLQSVGLVSPHQPQNAPINRPALGLSLPTPTKIRTVSISIMSTVLSRKVFSSGARLMVSVSLA